VTFILVIITVFIPDGWFVEDLGIYRPLTREQAFVADGKVFILDFDEQTIKRFDLEGAALPSIGKRGQGPGEFEAASSIYLCEGKLCVSDRYRTHRFTLDGTYIDTAQGEHYNEKLYRMPGGWLVRALPTSPIEDKRETLYWRPDLGEEITLLVWYSVWADHFGDGTEFRYNPVRERSMVALTADRERAFIRPSGKRELHIFDATAGEIIRTIPLEEPRVPFDTEYGARKLAAFEKRVARRGKPVIAGFPDYYPGFTGMMWTAEENLLLYQVTHEVGRARHSWTFDRNGDPVEARFRPEWQKYLIHLGAEHAYLLSFDPENEVTGFGRKPIAELSGYLADMQSEFVAWLLENR